MGVHGKMQVLIVDRNGTIIFNEVFRGSQLMKAFDVFVQEMEEADKSQGLVVVVVMKYRHGLSQGLSMFAYQWFKGLGSKSYRKCFQNNFGFALISNFDGILNEKCQIFEKQP